MIRILIVDDEPIARGGIRTLLGTQPDMEVVGECASGEEAIQAIRSARPDVVFLDIQMPDGDGFQVLESLHEEDGAPRIVFVTAYDDYAVRAFEVNAVDYLLKPFDRRRFLSTLDRIRTALEVGADPAGARERLRDLLEEFGLRRDAGSSRSYRDGRVIVRDRGRIRFVREGDIDWLEVRGNYVRLHVGDRSYLVRDTLTSLEERLDARRFLRISRSHSLNVERLEEMRRLPNGRYAFRLAGGVELESSRRYGERVERFFGIK